ncbi:MAG: hypothetical protein V4459_03940 [Pseudomonadota bacterium]
MRWLILFGILICAIADMTLLGGEYTRAVASWIGGFGHALRNTSASLWGVN